jgi:hypothetical protein
MSFLLHSFPYSTYRHQGHVFNIGAEPDYIISQANYVLSANSLTRIRSIMECQSDFFIARNSRAKNSKKIFAFF